MNEINSTDKIITRKDFMITFINTIFFIILFLVHLKKPLHYSIIKNFSVFSRDFLEIIGILLNYGAGVAAFISLFQSILISIESYLILQIRFLVIISFAAGLTDFYFAYSKIDPFLMAISILGHFVIFFPGCSIIAITIYYLRKALL